MPERTCCFGAVVGLIVGCGRFGVEVEDRVLPRTCLEAARLGMGTGKTALDPDADGPAPTRDVWCDQTRRGGGWVLALKIDGEGSTFAGTREMWTDTNLFHADDLVPDATGEAKLVPYIDYPVAEVMLAVDGGGDIVLPLRADSLRAALDSGFTIPTNVPEAEWGFAFGTTPPTTGCRRQGFGILGDPPPADRRGVRIGVVANSTLVDCRTPDSFIGIGGDVPCPDGRLLAAGTASPTQCTPARVLVFVRDDDRTYHSPLPSCADHLEAGRNDSGVYLVGDPPVPRRCQMTFRSGGWTNALDFDSIRDSCPAPWQAAGTKQHVCIDGTMTGMSAINVGSPIASFREVMTTVIGFQRGSTDGFHPRAIEDAYVDGLSITAGSPRRHIASYGVGFNEFGGCGSGKCACPCLGGQPAPQFMAENSWRCESGSLGSPMDNAVFFADPLFDGAEIDDKCAKDASADPIVTEFPPATAPEFEARLMTDEPTQGEGMALYRLELWVR